MFSRAEALVLLNQYIQNQNLIKHMLAVEACMRALALKFSENSETWAMSGLLHDLDYNQTKDDFSQHGLISAEILAKIQISQDIIDSIKTHPGHFPRESLMSQALYCVDPLTGLIVAAALMHPDKKLKSVDVKFVLNRMKEKHFAKGANREQINASGQLGIKLEEFISICLNAMQGIDNELGL
ncbi:MAG: HDIG domain-containing metalloprotein [Candidatus Omnitrophota bacterium]